MRQVTAAGGRVVVVWLTDGGGSHGELEPAQRSALVARRQKEALAGIEALGVRPAATYFLGFPDGFLRNTAQDARDSLERLRRRHTLDVGVVTAADDDHPDHRAACEIALGLGLTQLYSYPISARYDGAAYLPPANALFIHGDASDAKRRALLEHRSQASGAGAVYPMSKSAIERFCRDPEIFIPLRS